MEKGKKDEKGKMEKKNENGLNSLRKIKANSEKASGKKHSEDTVAILAQELSHQQSHT